MSRILFLVLPENKWKGRAKNAREARVELDMQICADIELTRASNITKRCSAKRLISA